MKKKLMMVLMVTMLLLFTMPFNVKASETEPSGTCGPNLTWRITDHGYLLIQGEGKMDDFSLIANQPWADYRDQITNVALDQGVSSIGENAFANCFSLEKVSMGDNVLSIGYSAFRQCKSLTHVILSKNLVSIDKQAFELCESLFSIVETNEEGAFGIGGITIPARVESIGEWAFAHCESIESVEFAWDAGVQLDVGTFQDCYSLKSVKLPDTLAELPATTFMNDSALENLVIPDSVTYIGVNAASYCTSLKSIVIPESVTEIDDAAFEGDSQLASVTIPENLTMINGTAFSDTPWIRAMGDYPVVNGVLLQYQGSDANVVIPGNVKRIGSASFYQNTKITSVTISPGVEVIGAHAFAFCSNLKTVSIPDSVISIGEEAFTSCRGLESITLPSGVKTLGVGLFSDCSLLKDLTIPSGIEEIPNMMLYSCRGLVSVSIPLSVKTIGNSVFNLCTSLTDIYYEGSKSDWSKIRKGNYNPQLSSAVIHYGKEDNVPVTGVEMSVASAEMITSKTTSTTPYTITQASTLQLHATIKPENATNQDVTWSSSNPAVAVVDENGLVTALTYGKTTITVTTEDGKKTAACQIQTRYNDVSDFGKYWFNPVYWAADHNVTKGYANIYFGPEENCTREQMITFLYRTAGSPAVSGSINFSDVQKGSYYYNAVLWAYNKGITKGYSSGPNKGKFGVGLNVTREDTVTFIYRMAGKPKYSTTKTFKDVAKGMYYYDPVRWAAQNKITNGYADGTFGVGIDVLRKDIVTFLYRYVSLK